MDFLEKQFLKKQEYTKVFTNIAIIVGIYLGMRFLLPLVWPFIIAFLIVALLYPLINRIWKKTHIGKGVLTGILLVFLLFGIFAGALFLCNQLFIYAGKFIGNLGNMHRELCCLIKDCCGMLENRFGINADEIEPYILNQITFAADYIEIEATPKLMGKSVIYMSSAASLIAGIAVTGIAIVLLIKDYEKLRKLLKKQKHFEYVFHILHRIGHLLRVFLKAQIIIMLVIAMISILGFFLLKQENPILFGIITALLDVLPFIGTGIVMIPLAILALIKGEFLIAVGYVILYVLCALAREFLEPKLIGEKIGIYPIGILLAVYVGIKLYGLSGIVLGPTMLLLIIELWQGKSEQRG